MRILLAILCLLSVVMILREYDPSAPMPPTFLAPFVAVVLAFLALSILLFVRPGPRVYAAALGLGAVLGAILLFAWYLGHVTATSGSAAQGWDAWILPFIGVQAAIVVVALFAMRSAREPW